MASIRILGKDIKSAPSDIAFLQNFRDDPETIRKRLLEDVGRTA